MSYFIFKAKRDIDLNNGLDIVPRGSYLGPQVICSGKGYQHTDLLRDAVVYDGGKNYKNKYTYLNMCDDFDFIEVEVAERITRGESKVMMALKQM